MSLLRSAAAAPAVAELRMKPARCWRSRASGARTVSESLASWASCLFCLARVARTLSVCCERRIGPPDDLGEVGAAGGEAGAEVVEDQPEPVGLGLAGDVVDEVEVDLLAVVLERQEVLARADVAVGDLRELGRRLGARSSRLGGNALDVLLAEQRLRADQAGTVGAEVLEAGIGDREHRDGLAGILVAVLLDALARAARP